MKIDNPNIELSSTKYISIDFIVAAWMRKFIVSLLL